MVNSDNDPGKGIDASAGGLVWVRRRNGSWWPGRIQGADELPENSVPIPRFGTPVKLLGREDASVDWYNLEKSKRIKAFRCGEFNDCIEKAKAAASNLSKKAVKYARREDAIIQALEIENAYLGNKHPDFSTEPDLHGGEHHHGDESPSSFHTSEGREDLDENMSNNELSNSSQESEDESDCAQELSQSGDESDLVDLAKAGSRCSRAPNDSEDDGTEGVKRMRGLEDLGMGVAPSLKRKRSQVARVHEFLKRKSRRRTLTKVLESTPVSKKNSSVVINNNSDSTGLSCENMITSLREPNHMNNGSLRCKQKENEISSVMGVPEDDSLQRLFDVPLVTEGKRSTSMSKFVSGASQKAHTGAGAQSSQSSHVETDHHESGSASSGTAEIHNIGQRIEKGTSKWQLKGKRNSRSRKVDLDDEADTGFPVDSSQSMDFNRVAGTLMTDNYHSHVKSRPVSEIQGVQSCGWGWNSRKGFRAGRLTPELPAPQRQLPYRQSRFTVNPKYESSEFSLRHHITGSGLYEVQVEVKASSRPQRVPCISLMSKLNGRPIIGHPIAIEKVKDGFCDNLIRTAECYSSSSEFDHCLGRDPANSKVLDKQKPRGWPPRRHRPPRSRRNVVLSKKTRKLSSLTGAHKNQEKKPVVEKLKGPCIACVPLSIVFSRINAAMNSSMRSAPRLAKSDNT
ncbi:hypothetical protein F511_25941 [Dorcoceras hygrometricum]|uniref:PWWP domain-containing protein n=1 Tax=Dorcoceras hygrometricum TaxID=472368 RepID=A0A2Z7BI68_9LAMI|nr:hypothetical protein F511_25941 [Dorcoceras hygrometricum]